MGDVCLHSAQWLPFFDPIDILYTLVLTSISSGHPGCSSTAKITSPLHSCHFKQINVVQNVVDFTSLLFVIIFVLKFLVSVLLTKFDSLTCTLML